MKNILELQICIASPSDVIDWRDEIEKIINEDINIPNGYQLKVVRWETDTPITSDIEDLEGHIINEIVKDSDILIGVFWTKFGSPTKNYDSGTEEEITYQLDNKKPVILYFVTKSIGVSEIDPKQLEKISNFKNKYKQHNFFRDIKSIDNLKSLLKTDLKHNIEKVINNVNNDSQDENHNVMNINKNEWYDESITDLINYYLKDMEYNIQFNRDMLFKENCKLANTKDIKPIDQVANQAREYAFDKKYGNYNYNNDVRHFYPKWAEKTRNILLSLTNIKGKSVIGIGSNYGLELKQIFKDDDNIKYNVLELSKEAINRGKKEYNDIIFFQGNMELPFQANKKFDIYINLRSIHSSGVSRNDTLIQSLQMLKSGGIILLSVSNGYLVNNENKKTEVVEGLYDHKSKTFSVERPVELASKIVAQLRKIGYENVNFSSIDTEILVWGVKP